MADVKSAAFKCAYLSASLILVALVSMGPLTHNNVVSPENLVLVKEEQIVNKTRGPIPGCNLFSGRWVYDDVSYPLYKEGQCSFMSDNQNCEKYGRQDLKYQNWRWQPHHCDIPRFNGTAFMEKIRGEKVVFVGDSLMRNQWRSMLCLIDSHLPPPSTKSLKLRGNIYYFHSLEYNATIMFQWAPFLVESNKDDMFNHRDGERIIGINSIQKHGRHWIDADILVFDAFIWWNIPKNMILMWGSFGSGDAVYKEVPIGLRQYEIALNTWSEWLELNINSTKTKMFFMSASPFHFGDGKQRIYYCHNQTEPIFDEKYWPSSVSRYIMQTAESMLEKLEKRGVQVEYMNITQLSGYRRDAHPSIYKSFPVNISIDQLIKNLDQHSDCVHWCLPGVPDVWNQILNAYITKS